MIKAILYIVVFSITVWAMSGIDLNRYFRQGKIYEARIIYLILASSLTYLVVNFFYDFFVNFQIVK